MKIKDILAKGQPTLSFEVFPPKEEKLSKSPSKTEASHLIPRMGKNWLTIMYSENSVPGKDIREVWPTTFGFMISTHTNHRK